MNYDDSHPAVQALLEAIPYNSPERSKIREWLNEWVLVMHQSTWLDKEVLEYNNNNRISLERYMSDKTANQLGCTAAKSGAINSEYESDYGKCYTSSLTILSKYPLSKRKEYN